MVIHFLPDSPFSLIYALRLVISSSAFSSSLASLLIYIFLYFFFNYRPLGCSIVKYTSGKKKSLLAYHYPIFIASARKHYTLMSPWASFSFCFRSSTSNWRHLLASLISHRSWANVYKQRQWWRLLLCGDHKSRWQSEKCNVTPPVCRQRTNYGCA